MVDIIIGPVITLILLIIVIYIALKVGKGLIGLIINSVVGLIVLGITNFLPFIDIEINLWSVLIVALGGIPGLVLVALLDFFGILF
jgi:inhibitor of the pro-sigma K processing machinery